MNNNDYVIKISHEKFPDGFSYVARGFNWVLCLELNTEDEVLKMSEALKKKYPNIVMELENSIYGMKLYDAGDLEGMYECINEFLKLWGIE